MTLYLVCSYVPQPHLTLTLNDALKALRNKSANDMVGFWAGGAGTEGQWKQQCNEREMTCFPWSLWVAP